MEYEDFIAPDAWGCADKNGNLKEVHLSWEHARMVARVQGWTLVPLDRRVEERVSVVEHSPEHREIRTEYGPDDAGIVEFIPNAKFVPRGFVHVASADEWADMKCAAESQPDRCFHRGPFVVARTDTLAVGVLQYDSYPVLEEACEVAEAMNAEAKRHEWNGLRVEPFTEAARAQAAAFMKTTDTPDAPSWSVVVETDGVPIAPRRCCDLHPDCAHEVLRDQKAPWR